ncbi:tRNA-specific adenosine deaminase 2 [Lepeophtheirus salmonis]|uniref:tRNA-specific adenosine deaminase 2 n=1 Tax=Lepeophtheirus salmonis TaxID=72036 RepID=UPI001AEB03B1|nr:tRNA-specific adenosine deaminase 2-like [Lepeophtheirus salmonis]
MAQEEKNEIKQDFKPEYLEIAFSLAKEALDAGEVPVGCVFVRNNKEIVAQGRNEVNATRNATRHAELVAIDTVDLSDASDLYLYVNVEPCIMCASALQQLNIKKIFFGCYNERFGGCGSVIDIFKIFSHLKIPIQGGFQEERAVSLLKEFYNQENTNAPPEKRKKKYHS